MDPNGGETFLVNRRKLKLDIVSKVATRFVTFNVHKPRNPTSSSNVCICFLFKIGNLSTSCKTGANTDL